MMEKAGRK